MIQNKNKESSLSYKNPKYVAGFLLDFADALMSSGTQTSRVVRNVERLSENFGCKTDVIILPKTIIMTVSTKGISATEVKKVSPTNYDFRILSKLRILSWEAYKKTLTLQECRRRFLEIKKIRPISWRVKALIVSVGNAAFCQLFGGFYSIPLIFFSTLTGFCFRHFLLKHEVPSLFSTIITAFISAFIASMGAMIFGFKTDIAVSTSILYLVPGVPMLNSFIDILDGHVLAGISRLADASKTILAMTIGLIFAIFLSGHSIL